MLLAAAVHALRATFEARRIALYTDAANASVFGDPGALSQVFYELMAQALHATPEGGRVEIRLERHDANARVSITDGRKTAATAADAATVPPSGVAAVRRVRQLEAQRGVPLDCRMPAITLTGHAQPDDRLTALMAGFQLHLAKPVDGAVLTPVLAGLAGARA